LVVFHVGLALETANSDLAPLGFSERFRQLFLFHFLLWLVCFRVRNF